MIDDEQFQDAFDKAVGRGRDRLMRYDPFGPVEEAWAIWLVFHIL